jgi:hypothetical protein
VAETTTREQIEAWREELAQAVAGQQWRRALQLCSWLRYALWQQGRSDPEVEQVQRQAKAAWAEHVAREKTQQERDEEHWRLRRKIMQQIISGDWEQALDSIEAFHQDGANRQGTIRLLEELEKRLGSMLRPKYRQMDQRAAVLGRRFDQLVEQVRDGSSMIESKEKW